MFVILLLALVLDRLAGDPQWLWRHIPHPVVFFGRLISFGERWGNRPGTTLRTRFLHGWLVIIALLAFAAGLGWLLARLCNAAGLAGVLGQAVIVSFFLAQKSLADHVMVVHDALENRGIEAGRKAVSMIVGRDTHRLEEGGICRAAIESLAENTSDGIIAPAFWFLLLGLPGLLAYKMLNTADSMIGYKNARYAAFGFAAARLDDAANYIPARLTGGLVVFGVFFQSDPLFQRGRAAAKRAWQVMMQDAVLHRSPNAGWPESAFAGALDVRLAGPRHYGAERVDEPFQNPGGHEPGLNDIVKAVRLFWSAMVLFAGLIAALTVLFSVYALAMLFY